MSQWGQQGLPEDAAQLETSLSQFHNGAQITCRKQVSGVCVVSVNHSPIAGSQGAQVGHEVFRPR